MPIDPSIPLGVRAPQLDSPMNALAQAQQFGLNNLKMQEAEQIMAERNALRGLDINAPDYISQVGRVNPKLALELQKGQLESKKGQVELEANLMKNARNTLAPINDQGTYDLWRQQTSAQLPGLSKFLPAKFDDKVKTSLMLEADKYIQQTQISASQQQTADVSKRGQDITAATTRRGQDKPVFNADYGGFVAPPSANAPQGSFIPVTDATGAPLQSNKPLTEAQAKGVGFALRAKEADSIINTVGKKGDVQPGLIKRTFESTPFIGEGLGTMANITQSPEQQKIEQAQRNFVNAVLRQESGAVINEDEFNNAKKQYFPQPGDSNDVIKQKEASRKTTIKALETQAGPGLKRAGGGKTEDPLGIR